MLCKRIWQTYSHRINFFQRFSTVQNVEPVILEEKSRKQKKKNKVTVSSEVINHFEENNLSHYLNFIPNAFLKKTKKKKYSLYLANRDTANKFCSLIADDLLNNTSYVIENNPGLGFLTEKLLEIGVPTVNLFEKKQSFLEPKSPLVNLFEKYKNRLILKELCFTDVWLMSIRDKYQCDNLSSSYLDDAPIFDWKDKCYAQIILFIPDRMSLIMIVYNFFNQTNMYSHGRPSFYIAVHSEVWDKLNILHDNVKRRRFYTQQNVLFNLFFDSQYFGELPRQSFLPWPLSKANNKVDELDVPLSVVKIEPKKDAYQILKKEDIRPFWFFLKTCMSSAKKRVIAQFESIAPGIGEKLLDKNIDITTTFKELSPEKLLEIFKVYRSSPNYDECKFIPNNDAKDEEEATIKIEEKQNQEMTS